MLIFRAGTGIHMWKVPQPTHTRHHTHTTTFLLKNSLYTFQMQVGISAFSLLLCLSANRNEYLTFCFFLVDVRKPVITKAGSTSPSRGILSPFHTVWFFVIFDDAGITGVISLYSRCMGCVQVASVGCVPAGLACIGLNGLSTPSILIQNNTSKQIGGQCNSWNPLSRTKAVIP